MATTSTIGTSSRDYSTISAWIAAFATGGWIGECYNDSEFAETIIFSGQATTATDYMTLRTAAGQSAFDSANPLLYDPTKGVAVLDTSGSVAAVFVQEDYVTITKMQFRQTNGGSRGISLFGPSNLAVDRCLCQFENSGFFGFTAALYLGSATTTVTNSVFISFGYPAVWLASSDNGSLINCTLVVPADKSAFSNGINVFSGTLIVENCAIFGFATSISTALTGDYNASDTTLPMGTHNQPSLVYADQFNGVNSGAMDFTLKTGSALIDTGLDDSATYPAIASDIFGTTRPQGSAFDISAYEYPQTPPPPVVPLMGQAIF